MPDKKLRRYLNSPNDLIVYSSMYYDPRLAKFVKDLPQPLAQAPMKPLAALRVSVNPTIRSREWLLANKVTADPVQSISEVLENPKVYIADAERVKDIRKLSELSIKYVLSLAKLPNEIVLKTADGKMNSNYDNIFAAAGIERIRAFFEDSGSADEKLIKYAYDCFNYLYEKANNESSGLVGHCEAGCSRSPLLVAAFIAKRNKKTLKESLEYISKYRHFSAKEELAIKISETLGIAIE